MRLGKVEHKDMATVSSPARRTWWGLRYGFRLALVTAGIACVTFGVVYWQHNEFTFQGLWFEDGLALHPLHLVAVGTAIVPAAIWDVFVMEAARAERARVTRPAGE